MKIAVDAMGGDFAPGEIVRGAVEAARTDMAEVLLVGDQELLEAELRAYPPLRGVEIVQATEVIAMSEAPAQALRKKKDASIVIATRLVKEGRASAVVSAGSTGAQMAAALLILGRIPGVSRPAIATLLPTLRGTTLLLDVGANVDCKPYNLVEFASMGSIYSERVLKLPKPRVGLLNIGVEKNKGNELTLAAYALLEEAQLEFIGNIEPRDVPMGSADVVVCDGFIGNILLKFGEGMAISMFSLLREKMAKSLSAKLGGALALPALKEMQQQVDYAEYGGAPLLGVNGVSIVCHGSSKAKAIRNAIKMAVASVSSNFVASILEVAGGRSSGHSCRG